MTQGAYGRDTKPKVGTVGENAAGDQASFLRRQECGRLWCAPVSAKGSGTKYVFTPSYSFVKGMYEGNEGVLKFTEAKKPSS